MRDQLEQYVNLLFAGAPNCEDIRQEILQNTLDRYDDLIAEGKVPEAAYRLAITGIGDINEILGTPPVSTCHTPAPTIKTEEDMPRKRTRAIAVGLYIICILPLIILSEAGLDTLGLCITLTIVAVATVMMILTSKPSPDDEDEETDDDEKEKSPLAKSISALIWAIGLALYFIASFTTHAWHITWVIFPILAALSGLAEALIEKRETAVPGQNTAAPIRKTVKSIIGTLGLILYFILSFTTRAWFITWLIFPITGAVQGLVTAILDLKEAVDHEN